MPTVDADQTAVGGSDRSSPHSEHRLVLFSESPPTAAGFCAAIRQWQSHVAPNQKPNGKVASLFSFRRRQVEAGTPAGSVVVAEAAAEHVHIALANGHGEQVSGATVYTAALAGSEAALDFLREGDMDRPDDEGTLVSEDDLAQALAVGRQLAAHVRHITVIHGGEDERDGETSHAPQLATLDARRSRGASSTAAPPPPSLDIRAFAQVSQVTITNAVLGRLATATNGTLKTVTLRGNARWVYPRNGANTVDIDPFFPPDEENEEPRQSDSGEEATTAKDDDQRSVITTRSTKSVAATMQQQQPQRLRLCVVPRVIVTGRIDDDAGPAAAKPTVLRTLWADLLNVVDLNQLERLEVSDVDLPAFTPAAAAEIAKAQTGAAVAAPSAIGTALGFPGHHTHPLPLLRAVRWAQLQHLVLTGLGLTVLPDELRAAKLITALNVSDNPLRVLPPPGYFDSLPLLHRFTAARCRLTASALLRLPPTATAAYLAGNRIERLAPLLYGAQPAYRVTLQTLDLQDNLLATWEDVRVVGWLFPRLDALRAFGNPFFAATDVDVASKLVAAVFLKSAAAAGELPSSSVEPSKERLTRLINGLQVTLTMPQVEALVQRSATKMAEADAAAASIASAAIFAPQLPPHTHLSQTDRGSCYADPAPAAGPTTPSNASVRSASQSRGGGGVAPGVPGSSATSVMLGQSGGGRGSAPLGWRPIVPMRTVATQTGVSEDPAGSATGARRGSMIDMPLDQLTHRLTTPTGSTPRRRSGSVSSADIAVPKPSTQTKIITGKSASGRTPTQPSGPRSNPSGSWSSWGGGSGSAIVPAAATTTIPSGLHRFVVDAAAFPRYSYLSLREAGGSRAAWDCTLPGSDPGQDGGAKNGVTQAVTVALDGVEVWLGQREAQMDAFDPGDRYLESTLVRVDEVFTDGGYVELIVSSRRVRRLTELPVQVTPFQAVRRLVGRFPYGLRPTAATKTPEVPTPAGVPPVASSEDDVVEEEDVASPPVPGSGALGDEPNADLAAFAAAAAADETEERVVATQRTPAKDEQKQPPEPQATGNRPAPTSGPAARMVAGFVCRSNADAQQLIRAISREWSEHAAEVLPRPCWPLARHVVEHAFHGPAPGVGGLATWDGLDESVRASLILQSRLGPGRTTQPLPPWTVWRLAELPQDLEPLAPGGGASRPALLGDSAPTNEPGITSSVGYKVHTSLYAEAVLLDEGGNVAFRRPVLCVVTSWALVCFPEAAILTATDGDEIGDASQVFDGREVSLSTLGKPTTDTISTAPTTSTGSPTSTTPAAAPTKRRFNLPWRRRSTTETDTKREQAEKAAAAARAKAKADATAAACTRPLYLLCLPAQRIHALHATSDGAAVVCTFDRSRSADESFEGDTEPSSRRTLCLVASSPFYGKLLRHALAGMLHRPDAEMLKPLPLFAPTEGAAVSRPFLAYVVALPVNGLFSILASAGGNPASNGKARPHWAKHALAERGGPPMLLQWHVHRGGGASNNGGSVIVAHDEEREASAGLRGEGPKAMLTLRAQPLEPVCQTMRAAVQGVAAENSPAFDEGEGASGPPVETVLPLTAELDVQVQLTASTARAPVILLTPLDGSGEDTVAIAPLSYGAAVALLQTLHANSSSDEDGWGAPRVTFVDGDFTPR